MHEARFGLGLQVVGIIGIVAMVVGIGVTIHQSSDIDSRADDVLLPVAGGLADLDEQLATVSQLWADVLAALPEGSTADLAETVIELNATLEQADQLIDTARRGLDAVDGIPFIPIDTAEMRTQLEGLEEGLAFVTPLLQEASDFLARDEGAAEDVVQGVSSGLEQIGTGLDAAEREVASITVAVDRWLVAGSVMMLVLLAWGIAGQIALIVLGRRLAHRDGSPALTNA